MRVFSSVPRFALTILGWILAICDALFDIVASKRWAPTRKPQVSVDSSTVPYTIVQKTHVQQTVFPDTSTI